HMVLVLHVTIKHVGNGFEATMWMRGEAPYVIAGFRRSKLIHHQERVEAREILSTEHAHQSYAVTVRGGMCHQQFINPSCAHAATSSLIDRIDPPCARMAAIVCRAWSRPRPLCSSPMLR